MAAERRAKRTVPRNAHDSLFRAALDDPERAADFLRCHLPARVLREFADELPEIVGASFVRDSLANRQSDRLLRVKLRNGEHAYVHVVIEHTSTVVPFMALRLLGYRVQIWEREIETTGVKPGRLPAIYSVVVYHGKAPWTAPRSVLDMITGTPALRSQLRGFGYRLRDFGRMRSDRLARHSELKGVSLTLKHEHRDRIAPRVVLWIEELLPEGTKLATQTRRHILARFNTDRAKLEAAREEKGRKPVGELAESYLSQGRAEGRAEGEAKGRVEGRASILNRQLQRRFGRVPSRFRERVRCASVQELDEWADAVLEAPTLEAVFGDSPKH